MSPLSLPEGGELFRPLNVRVARPFPRHKSYLFTFVVFLWLGFGIFGRDPWKPDELVLTAYIAEMARGGLKFIPTLLGQELEQYPPLYLWLSALLARLFSFYLPLHEGARLINIILLSGGLFLTGKAVASLYGLRVAWLSVLLIIGGIGFMIPTHQLNVDVAAFFGMALVLYAMTILVRENHQSWNTLTGCAIVSFGLVFLGWSVSVVTAVTVWLGIILFLLPKQRKNMIIMGVITILSLPWLFVSMKYSPSLFNLVLEKWGDLGQGAKNVGDLLRVGAWSLFPLLPLAIVGLWFNRKKDSLFYFAVISCGVSLFLFLLMGKKESNLYLIFPPLALIASRALQLIPDQMAHVLDFFALMIVGLCCVGGLWLVWWALYSGTPDLIFIALSESWPGYTLPAVSWVKVSIAALLTVGWLMLISNFGLSNERAVINWGCGVTVVWGVFNLLLVGYVDSGKSYRHVSAEIAKQVGEECLTPPEDKNWRTSLYYFGVPMGQSDQTCLYYLSPNVTDKAQWHGSRNGLSQRYGLYRRDF